MKSKDSETLYNPELNCLYEKIKLSKANKVIKVQPLEKTLNIMSTAKKESVFVQFSPNKKLNIVQTSKKTNFKLEDTENKKIFNE